MARKKQNKEELWSKRFDEDIEENVKDKYSRSQKKKREQTVSPVLTITVVVLGLIIAAIILGYTVYRGREAVVPEQPEIITMQQGSEEEEDTEEDSRSEEEEPEETIEETQEQPDLPTEDPVEIEAEEVAAEEVAEEVAEETIEEAQEAAIRNQTETETVNAQAEEIDQVVSEPELEAEIEEETEAEELELEEETTGGSTYTVQPGDNMYRIALNHGLSTEELMALNGLDSTTVSVGQVLRVE